MSEPSNGLIALFAQGEAPAVDPLFTLAVVAELERRAAIRRFVWSLAYSALAVVLIATGWPAIIDLAAGLKSAFGVTAPFVLAAAVAAACLMTLGRPWLRGFGARLSLPG